MSSTKRQRTETSEEKGPQGRKVTVAATQMACSIHEEVNIERAEELVRKAAAAGADIVLIQELFAGPYFCIDMLSKHFALAKPAKNNPLLLRMSILAKELNVVIPVSFFEAAGNCFYNSLCMIDSDGSQLGVYRKSHIPDGNGYSEKFYFSPGDTGFKVWETLKCKVGVAICWDQWFPEAARVMSLQGADVILYPTAIGSEPHDPTINSREHWQRTMQGHAAANCRPVIASNRVGKELSLANKDWSITFYGNSFITDGTGAIIKSMDSSSEGFITHTFDLDALEADRAAWGVFRDRRPEMYSPLLTLDGQSGSTVGTNSRGGFVPRAAPAATKKSDSQAARILDPTDYRMPAEWEPHAGCWIGFPERADNWPHQGADAQQCFISICKAISEFEPVNLCVSSRSWSRVSSLVKDFPAIRVVELTQDDSWFRDTAPLFVVPRSVGKPDLPPLAGVCWGFNGYGGLYTDFKNDQLIAPKICSFERVPTFQPEAVLEGGAIHVDGLGTLITTEQCLLKPNCKGNLRNPASTTRKDLEDLFARYLGISKVLWLPQGILADLDTNEHVDNMCCFLRPGVVALHWVEKNEDANQHAVCQGAFDFLSKETDARGQPLQVVKVAGPRNLRRTKEECPSVNTFDREEGEVLPGSYINFFMPNGAAIVPQFGDVERDHLALAVYCEQLPTRRVIGLPARQVLVGGGCIHCILMQEPLGNQG